MIPAEHGSLKFRFFLFLAEKFYMFHHDGLTVSFPSWMPTAYVDYIDGTKSKPMPIGNCINYARIFNGTVREIK